MTRLLYLVPNERYDTLMGDLNQMDEDALAQANAGRKRALLKLMHLKDLPVVARFAKERLGL